MNNSQSMSAVPLRLPFSLAALGKQRVGVEVPFQHDCASIRQFLCSPSLSVSVCLSVCLSVSAYPCPPVDTRKVLQPSGWHPALNDIIYTTTGASAPKCSFHLHLRGSTFEAPQSKPRQGQCLEGELVIDRSLSVSCALAHGASSCSDGGRR